VCRLLDRMEWRVEQGQLHELLRKLDGAIGFRVRRERRIGITLVP
jgi:hypothetical protein